ncbi:ribokinase [Sphingomonas sp. DT-204]|uniref:ribokinase n=1 Tax=Sphingomonas sp. DT-204 TaxID=3396166 RepID=UPI003F1B2F0E
MAICVLGSINVDVILSVAALPRPGETVMARDAVRLPGGKGANQAVAAARMGAATVMLGAVGADEAGDWMRAALKDAGVDVAQVHSLAEAGTGTAYIAVDAGAENQIIVASGANAHVSSELLSDQPQGSVLLAQLEIPVEVVAAAFAKPGPLRILNAAPTVPEATSLFSDADVLIVNQHELAVYLRVQTIETPRQALEARALLSRPGQVAIVTLGAEGALAVWRDRAFHAPALPVTPVDTVGAGDCFCGALAALLDEGMMIERALPLANAAAALCTQARGAVPAMPTRAAVEAFLIGAPT